MFNLNIKREMILFSIFLVLLFILFGLFSILKTEQIGTFTHKLYKHPLAVTTASIRANMGVVKIHRDMKDVALAKNSSQIETAVAKVDLAEREVFKDLDLIKERILGVEGKNLEIRAREIFTGWRVIRDEVITLAKAGKKEEAALITKQKGANYVKKINSSMEDMTKYAFDKADGFMNKVQTTQNEILNIIIISIVIITIAVILTLFRIYRITVNEISIIKNRAKNLSVGDGDLTKKLNITSKNEIGSVGKYIDMFIDKIHNTVADAKNTATSNSTSAKQLYEFSLDIRKASQDRNEKITDISNSNKEMSVTLKENLISHEKAKDYIEEANDNLNESKKDVGYLTEEIKKNSEVEQELTNRLNQLSQDTSQIKSVLTIISDIADQTNLLSLNAAIEAARAGEHGRGFAVVAEEVRALAEKTQKSLSDIDSTINLVVQGINDINSDMNKNLASVNNIVTVSEKVNEKIVQTDSIMIKTRDITLQSVKDFEHISHSIEDIIHEISDINNLSIKNGDKVAQITDLSKELLSITESLNVELNQFKT